MHMRTHEVRRAYVAVYQGPCMVLTQFFAEITFQEFKTLVRKLLNTSTRP
jgi:hypothetical protein